MFNIESKAKMLKENYSNFWSHWEKPYSNYYAKTENFNKKVSD